MPIHPSILLSIYIHANHTCIPTYLSHYGMLASGESSFVGGACGAGRRCQQSGRGRSSNGRSRMRNPRGNNNNWEEKGMSIGDSQQSSVTSSIKKS